MKQNEVVFAVLMTLTLVSSTCATTPDAATPKVVTKPEPALPTESTLRQADAKRRAGDLVGAVESYERATLKEPDNVLAWYGLGESFRLQKKFEQAAAAYQRTVDIDASHAGALEALVATLRMTGRCADAVAALEKIKPEAPALTEASVQFELANCERAEGRFEPAEQRLRKLLDQRPDDVNVLEALALNCAAKGQFGKSEAILRTALALQETNASLHVNLGAVLMKTNRQALAQTELQRALALNANLAAAPLNLGILTLSQRDYVNAERYLKQALLLEPESFDVLIAYGFAVDGMKSVDSKRGAEAGELFERALKLKPKNAKATCGAAWAYAEDKQTLAKAISFLEQCRAFDTTAEPERKRIDSRLRTLASQAKKNAEPAAGPAPKSKASLVDALSTEGATDQASGTDAGVNSR